MLLVMNDIWNKIQVRSEIEFRKLLFQGEFSYFLIKHLYWFFRALFLSRSASRINFSFILQIFIGMVKLINYLQGFLPMVRLQGCWRGLLLLQTHMRRRALVGVLVGVEKKRRRARPYTYMVERKEVEGKKKKKKKKAGGWVFPSLSLL